MHPHPYNTKTTWQPVALGITTLFALSACGGSSSDSDSGADADDPAENTAIVRTVASDFGSGEVELIDLDGDPLTASGFFSGSPSDLAVSTFANSYFLLERFQLDRIKRIDLDDPSDVVWEYATIDEADDASANPAQLVTLRDDKAYLLRENSSRAWIVDPSADDEDDFKQGELDLSAYVPDDNEAIDHPSIVGGVIVDDLLFVVMQRLDDDFEPTHPGYVAVFDTATDDELDTHPSNDGLLGIELETRNPNDLEHHPDAGLFVHSVGDRAPDERIGGIERIDPFTFERETVLDERNINGLAIRDADSAFFFEYEGFGDIVLFPLDLDEGEPGDPVNGFSNQDLRDIEIGPDGQVWIANAEMGNPRVDIYNPETGTVDMVTTDLLPASIDFAGREEDELEGPE